jgi:hypothetical protein
MPSRMGTLMVSVLISAKAEVARTSEMRRVLIV